MPDQTTDGGRQAPYQGGIPALRYLDARRAILWLVDVLGAEAGQAFEEGGVVQHAELWFGSACVMLGTVGQGDTPPTIGGQGSVYLPLESRADVDTVYRRARDRDANFIRPLRETPYGSYEFGVLDPEGNYWSFGTYVPAR
jgi:uncharacterized glyoxalase superfamily protein PhnB